MKIEKILTSTGLSGYYNKDLKAVKAGATPDGFVYREPPMTPGFYAIMQPGQSLSVMLLLSDGQVAFGDCVDVVFTGAAGRDPLFRSADHEETIQKVVGDFLRGKAVLEFKPLAETVDSMQVGGKRLHTAVRYGVTQALLDAVAKAHHTTMTEVIESEYQCKAASKPVPILGCATNDQKLQIDKMVMKKVPFLPHGSTSNKEKHLGAKGEKLLEYARWLAGRIDALREPDYHPTIHLDVYGTLGEAFELNVPKIASYIHELQSACRPFPLWVETPIIADTRDEQIWLYKDLLDRLKSQSVDVKIIADEWCNTWEDVDAFSKARAADIIQVKPPDMGGINNSIRSALLCKERGIGTYVGGTVNGTDQSARITTHIALATQADLLLAKPGQGFDEGLMIEFNEMQRTLALISRR